jgi:hypothetical protein
VAAGSEVRRTRRPRWLSGETPLDFMLQVMRDVEQPLVIRMDAAKSAAPFVHPKRAAVSHVVSETPFDLSQLSDEDLVLADGGASGGRLGAGAAGGNFYGGEMLSAIER